MLNYKDLLVKCSLTVGTSGSADTEAGRLAEDIAQDTTAATPFWVQKIVAKLGIDKLLCCQRGGGSSPD